MATSTIDIWDPIELLGGGDQPGLSRTKGANRLGLPNKNSRSPCLDTFLPLVLLQSIAGFCRG
jgi:hypothetical protein